MQKLLRLKSGVNIYIFAEFFQLSFFVAIVKNLYPGNEHKLRAGVQHIQQSRTITARPLFGF